ncbi:hypothetical protein Tco_1398240 [Tanacetum coccineum]
MKSIQTFLKKFNRISFRETPKVLLLAWEKFFEIKHAFKEKQHQPEDIQELLRKLLKDLQIISEELAEYINSLSWNCSAFYDDDDEYTIQYREYLENLSNAIIPDLPTEEPDNSLSMGDKHLDTILETKSDEVIKSSVEDLVPIPSEFEGISDDTCDVPFCDNSPPLDVLNDHFEIFSDSNDDFTSSDDESLSDEDISEDIKIYSNPLFEFDDEYIYSDVNPLFDEVLEDIECKDFYDSNLDESTLLLTPFSDANKDECFEPRGVIDEIDAFLDMDISTDIENGYHDSEGDIIYLESLLINDTIPNLPPEVFLDHDPRSLKDEPDKDDLKSIFKIFDPGIYEKKFSPTYVNLPFEDRRYLSFTYVIRIFLSYFTYPVESPLPLPSGTGGISSEWNFYVLQYLSKHLE